MLFTSLEFLVFLPLVVGAYYWAPPRWTGSLLLISSIVFYAVASMGHPEHALLLLWLAMTAQLAVFRMTSSNPGEARRWFIFGIFAVLAPLVVFKYWNFSAGAGNALATSIRLGTPQLPLHQLAVPVGISFITLQTLSYVIDVYLGRARPARTLAQAASFVSFFPLALAGPIERAGNLMPQLTRPASLECGRLVVGGRLLLWGFFKKLVIADNLAALVGVVYDGTGAPNGLAVLVATYAFAIQIYCDFSGYTDIARGAAQLLGIDVMQNFDAPYEARSIAEFWRRWHLSLSTWLRDYVFTPLSLGGNRTPVRGYAAVLFTFMVSGLWHGAGWTFVAWGFLHGVYIASSLVSRRWRDRLWGSGARGRTRTWVARFTTFHLVCISWIVFRSASLGRAVELLTRLVVELPGNIIALLSGQAALSAFGAFARWELVALVGGGVAVLLAERAVREPRVARALMAAPGGRLALYALILYAIVFLGNFGETAFIYSQF